MGLEMWRAVNRESIGRGAVLLVAILWLTPGCLRSVCDEAVGGCAQLGDGGTDDFDAGSGGGDRSALLGTWTFSGSVPAVVTLSLTFEPDQTCSFVEQVAPPTHPAGYHSDGCVTTDTYSGTYSETASGGTNTLTWTFAKGRANAISECAANDSDGTPMTADDVTAYAAQGLILHPTENYAVTATTLVLTPGLGSASSTVFRKSP